MKVLEMEVLEDEDVPDGRERDDQNHYERNLPGIDLDINGN